MCPLLLPPLLAEHLKSIALQLIDTFLCSHLSFTRGVLISNEDAVLCREIKCCKDSCSFTNNLPQCTFRQNKIHPNYYLGVSVPFHTTEIVQFSENPVVFRSFTFIDLQL